MANNERYRELEQMMARVLIADVVLLGLFLMFAGLGVAAMKTICAIAVILVSVLCVAFLYKIGVARKRCALWMVVGFVSVLVCLLVSLICKYPSPLT